MTKTAWAPDVLVVKTALLHRFVFPNLVLPIPVLLAVLTTTLDTVAYRFPAFVDVTEALTILMVMPPFAEVSESRNGHARVLRKTR